MKLVTASIVLYKTSLRDVNRIVQNLLSTDTIDTVFLVDNSPDDKLRSVANNRRISYIHNPTNPGFGAGHNRVINLALKDRASYHFIVNPDIYFNEDIISLMVNYMEINSNVGMLMPEILNPDGTIQSLPKLLPTPLSIILRKLKKPAGFYKKFIDKYELRFVDRQQIYKASILSGCFTLLNLKAVNEVGAYDDNFFMYFEDWDLSRRMAEKFETVYFPKVSVYHEYESGANKSFFLFKVYLKSAIYYFNKWGWCFDKKRQILNTQTLEQFNK